MFGLLNRDTLPTVVLDEFEHLVSSLKAFLLKEHNEDGTHFTSTATNIPLGGILPYSGAAAPNASWKLCDGSALSRATYQSLFNLIGTTYGAGDGSTTFNIPNLQQRFPLGKASAGTGSTLGSTGGAIDHTHGVSGLSVSGVTGATAPGTDSQGSHSHGGATGAHTHTVGITSDVATITTSGFDTGLYVGPGTGTQDQHTHGVNGNTGSTTATISADGSHSHTVNSHTHGAGTLAVTGAATDANNPPYTVINYIILVT
jgi:microcystin-dependent protein